jgi:hypothetical protein
MLSLFTLGSGHVSELAYSCRRRFLSGSPHSGASFDKSWNSSSLWHTHQHSNTWHMFVVVDGLYHPFVVVWYLCYANGPLVQLVESLCSTHRVLDSTPRGSEFQTEVKKNPFICPRPKHRSRAPAHSQSHRSQFPVYGWGRGSEIFSVYVRRPSS